MPNQKIKIIAVAIVSMAVVLAVTSFWRDSLIVDEVPHVGAGYSYLVKQDLRLNPEHPPLAKNLAALPLLFLNLGQTAFDTNSWQKDVNGQWEFGRNLIFNSGNNTGQITRLVKFPMLLFFVLSALLIFKWAKKLYGNTTALTATVLFSFSPTILAHTRFVATDIPALFGVLLATYFFVNYLESSKVQPLKSSGSSLILAGLAFGIALVTKFSTFLLVPYFLILATIWGLIDQRWRGTVFASLAETKTLFTGASRYILKTILIFVMGIIFVVWPLYFFNTYHYPPDRQKADTANLLQFYGNRPLADAVIWASGKSLLKPLASYGLGLLMVNQRATGGNTTYFLGEVSRFGWHHYFPLVYLIKEPLAWWGLVLIAVLTAISQFSISNFQFSKITNWVKNNFSEFAMLLWLLIFWAISLKSTLNIGVRHLLPTYPFAILLVSGQLTALGRKLYALSHKKLKRTKFWLTTYGLLLIAMLSWYAVENIKIWPHYLAYFNQMVGGPSGGYKYVVDSNLDWGQDLKRFTQWVEKNDIPKIELDYFGWADPLYYLGSRYERLSSQKYKNAEDFRTRNQTDGWLAVSTTFLQGSQGSPDQFKPINYLWLQNFQPTTTIGHSIFVYQIK